MGYARKQRSQRARSRAMNIAGFRLMFGGEVRPHPSNWPKSASPKEQGFDRMAGADAVGPRASIMARFMEWWRGERNK